MIYYAIFSTLSVIITSFVNVKNGHGGAARVIFNVARGVVNNGSYHSNGTNGFFSSSSSSDLTSFFSSSYFVFFTNFLGIFQNLFI